MKRALRGLLFAALWLVAGIAALWAAGALAFDLPWAAARTPAAIAFLAAVVFAGWRLRAGWQRLAAVFAAAALVLVWWLTLTPRNDRKWQPDVAETAWADVSGDTVTLHNVRRCDYRTELDYTAHWETRTVTLSKLTGVDIAITYWGSPYMAHPIISFQFADALPVCFSVETRKEVGESYSAVGGLYRQYELTYVVADERDVLRLRSNYRKGEDVYLYRLKMSPADARERFMEYVASLNALRDKPRWYNAVTANCTTAVRAQRSADGRAPWDWRMLVNGFGDEMLYERGAIVTDGLSFPELKRQALINPAAISADQSPDFSRVIREGRAGFGTSQGNGK